LIGSDLTRKVLEINPELPIILMTDYVGEDIPGGIPRLPRDRMSKPFTRSEFFDILEKTIVRASERMTATASNNTEGVPARCPSAARIEPSASLTLAYGG
jgi:FixJ family two-component response regulator